jgi:hypothetical protein
MNGHAGLVTVIEKRLANGWGLNMIALALSPGPRAERGMGDSVLVHSPTYDGDESFAKVDAIGKPRILFAPNHFHHQSLPKFIERYPEAAVVATEKACVRLRKRGHARVQPLASVTLPSGVRFLEPPGTRAGEAFLSIDDHDGARAWVVSDAFFNVERSVTGLGGMVLRALKTTPGLAVGQTFLWLALADGAAYKEWILAALARERPTRLYVSHGETAEAPDLYERLAQLVRARVA